MIVHPSPLHESEGRVAISVRGLDVERSGELVIEGANFDIKCGEYVGIVGPNGGGKTTLLLVLLGVLPKKRGEIKILGIPQERFSLWGKVGYVSQTATHFDPGFPMTVRELVGLGLISRSNLARKLKKEEWQKVDEVLEFLGISDISSKRIGSLSGGQKQRVFIAKALVRDPEILFLDEPIAGIDSASQQKFYQTLSDLNKKKGTTIIIVSHDLSVVFCRMSKVLCVNRKVMVSRIDDTVDPEKILRSAYGEHFHFVFHRHECEGMFEQRGNVA